MLVPILFHPRAGPQFQAGALLLPSLMRPEGYVPTVPEPGYAPTILQHVTFLPATVMKLV